MQKNDTVSTLRIMHCLRAPLGGLFRHVCDLIRGQKAMGLSVGIICDIGIGDKLAGQVLEEFSRECDLGAHRLTISRRVSIRDVLTYRHITAICKAQAPNILHGHGAKGGAFARLLARSLGVAAVYTPHGGALHYGTRSPSGRFYISIERLLRQWTDGLIFESDYARRAYIDKVGALPAHSRLIFNGLHEEEFSSLDNASADYDFVFVGELRRLKGPQVMVEALSRIDRPCRALIVGTGPASAELARYIHAHGLDSRVTLAPPVYPATNAFAKGACVVVPSLAESLPYVVLEAAAARRPLIATDIGGIPEIFASQATRLVKAGDAAALAEAMTDYLDHPGEARERAGRLQARVREHFRVSQMVTSTSEFYGEVMRSCA